MALPVAQIQELLPAVPGSYPADVPSPNSRSDIDDSFVWDLFVIHPLPRTDKNDMQRKQIAIPVSGAAMSLYSKEALPSGKMGRILMHYINTQALSILEKKYAEGGDDDEVHIIMNPNPVEAFIEMTGYKGRRGRHMQNAFSSFIRQLNRLRTMVIDAKIIRDGQPVMMTTRVIDSVIGWAEKSPVNGKKWHVQPNVGRPSREAVRANLSQKHAIVVAPEYIRRVLKQGGSHRKIYPVPARLMQGCDALQIDILQVLHRFLYQTQFNKNGEVTIPWDLFTHSMCDTVPESKAIEKDRRYKMKQALLKALDTYNHFYRRISTPVEIVHTTTDGVTLRGAPPAVAEKPSAAAAAGGKR